MTTPLNRWMGRISNRTHFRVERSIEIEGWRGGNGEERTTSIRCSLINDQFRGGTYGRRTRMRMEGRGANERKMITKTIASVPSVRPSDSDSHAQRLPCRRRRRRPNRQTPHLSRPRPLHYHRSERAREAQKNVKHATLSKTITDDNSPRDICDNGSDFGVARDGRRFVV